MFIWLVTALHPPPSPHPEKTTFRSETPTRGLPRNAYCANGYSKSIFRPFALTEGGGGGGCMYMLGVFVLHDPVTASAAAASAV